MECCFVADEDNLEPCGEEATWTYNLLLCEEHKEYHKRRLLSNTQSLSKMALRYHDFADFPGWCYVILLPSGLVKIGYSNTSELLRKRMQSLKRDLGPIIELAVLPGGFVTEAYLHERFNQYRVPGKGEKFKYSEELAAFLVEQQNK